MADFTIRSGNYHAERWVKIPDPASTPTPDAKPPELENLEIFEANRDAPSNVLRFEVNAQGKFQVDPKELQQALQALDSQVSIGHSKTLYLYDPIQRVTFAMQPSQLELKELSQLAKTRSTPIVLDFMTDASGSNRQLQQDLKDAIAQLRQALGKPEQIRLDIPPDRLIEGRDGKRYQYVTVDGIPLKAD